MYRGACEGNSSLLGLLGHMAVLDHGHLKGDRWLDVTCSCLESVGGEEDAD